ncbi:MAG: hypothetical protein M1168_02630 [Candidatus Marsarchaeota archaeon]|nr:hypothetical protein [Candidatus Marsarchaeota archaeon]
MLTDSGLKKPQFIISLMKYAVLILIIVVIVIFSLHQQKSPATTTVNVTTSIIQNNSTIASNITSLNTTSTTINATTSIIQNNSIHAHEHYNIFFQNNATHLNINVKAIAQTENSNLSSGYGPAYLLNGLTNNGYWYQVGLGYNFNYTDNKNVDNYSGFRLIYEVWNSSTGKPLNIGCGDQACVKNFTGVVNNNDTILLNMSIVRDNVILSAYDTNTTARSPTINITSYGASFFTSKPFTSKSIDMEYFSGLMTEWICRGKTNFTQRSVYSIMYPKTNIEYYTINSSVLCPN